MSSLNYIFLIDLLVLVIAVVVWFDVRRIAREVEEIQREIDTTLQDSSDVPT